MSSILSEFYGDNTRWFIATVIDATPPYGLEGRVRIRVHGLHTESTKEIPQRDLPWAQCVIPTTEGGSSGIGRVPQLQPNALVFGFFMDGINSQTPIVIGSLSHIEYPTIIQTLQQFEDIGDDNKPNSAWEKVTELFRAKNLDVKDTETGSIFLATKQAREKATIRFFVNIGYSVTQSVAIATMLSSVSGMMTGTHPRGIGIASWSNIKYNDVKNFSNTHYLFYTQLAYLSYDLKGKSALTNIKLLQTEKGEGNDGALEVFAKNYLRTKPDANALRSFRRLYDDAMGN